MRKANQEESRQHNRLLVFNLIYQQGEISRVGIARQTGLTRTTVSEMVAEFIEAGLVVETGMAASTGGKPATLLQVAQDARLLVGIDLAESQFCGALVNLRGQIVQRLCLPVADSSAEAALEQVYNLVAQLLRLADRPVIGIGIGVPGLMDPERARVREAVNLDWHDLPLGNLLHQRFELPIHLANDCQAAALGEFIFGQKRRQTNLLVIKAGRGIGAGLVLNGQIFYGDHAGAGEIGHIQMVPAGEPCRCGNTGCLETVASTRALLHLARGLDPAIVDFETFLQEVRNGNSRLLPLVDDAAQALGETVKHLVSALNINQILIAGSLSRLGETLLVPLRRSLQGGVLPALAQHTDIDLATLGDEIVILGAASLVLKQELGLF
jgi:predicted NBD/HSP70 family sugar kinase